MEVSNKGEIEKIDSKSLLLFIKIFVIYIFLENFFLSLSANYIYYNAVKMAGDLIIIIFAIFTLSKTKTIKIYKEQKIAIVALFILLAIGSTIKNGLNALDLFIGIRSLFRYYAVYLLSFYYNIKTSDFKRISDFIIKSFYVEIVLFSISYLFFGTINVLNQGYLPMSIYLNTVFALILFEGKFNMRTWIIMLLISAQAFLSTSRLAFFGIIIQSAIFIALLWKKNLTTRIVSGSLIVFLAASLFYFTPVGENIKNSFSYEKIVSTEFTPSEDSNFRFYLMMHFTDLSMKNQNLLGDGPNTFGNREKEQYHYNLGFNEITIKYAADSHYAILLMCYGFIGLIIYYYLIYALYNAVDDISKRFFVTYLSFILIASLAIPVFSMRISTFLMFVFFGTCSKKNGAFKETGVFRREA